MPAGDETAAAQLADNDKHSREQDTSGETVSEFNYPALSLKEGSIRLLQVKPELSSDGHIQCDIRESNTRDAYTCLSYEWGSETPSKFIFVGKALFPVRQNLQNFLHKARQRHHCKWLWIDALCINQADTAERNHQVQQMGQVYSQAQEVISWLGTDESIIRFLAPETTRESDDCEAFRWSTYWLRAWITQEITLARRVTVVAGDSELDLSSAVGRYKQYVDPDRRHKIFFSLSWNPAEWITKQGQSLMRLLIDLDGRKCRTFHDTVYSLLALCGDGSSIKVDYRTTRQQLAMQVFQSCDHLLCLCTVVRVAKELDFRMIPRNYRMVYVPEVHSHTSYAQLILPTAMLPDKTRSFSIVLESVELCAAGNGGFLELQLTRGQSHVVVADCKSYWIPHIKRREPYDNITALERGLTAEWSPDFSSCAIRMSFAALVNLALFFVDQRRVCKHVRSSEDIAGVRVRRPALTLCQPAV